MDKLKNNEEIIHGLFINLFNLFCHLNGIQIFEDLISQEKFNQKSGGNLMTFPYLLPFEYIAQSVAPFKNVKFIALPEIIHQLIETCKITFISRIQSMDVKDIKDINREQIRSSMETIKDFLQLSYSPEESSKIVETHNMLLMLKFIKSPYLERRLQGISDIRHTIERIEPTQINVTHTLKFYQNPRDSWLTPSYFAKWLVNNKIFEVIFCENVHPEMIKKSVHLLSFLARKDCLNNELLELLWKCQREKHEDIVRAVMETIKEILNYLKLDQIRLLYQKVKEIPLESYDEKLIHFMKDFTQKAFVVLSTHNKLKLDFSKPIPLPSPELDKVKLEDLKEPDDPDLFFIPTFWTLMLDSTNISQNLTDLSMHFLRECLKEFQCSKYYPQYYKLCLANLVMHKSVKQSLTLAPYIMALYGSQKITGTQLLSKKCFGQDLITIILNDFEYYEEIVRNSGIQNINENTIFLGKYGHLANLESRFKFLELILNVGNEELRMGIENLQRLWHIFVTNAPHEFDTQLFFKWISQEKETINNIQPVPIFKQDENIQLFELISNKDTSQILSDKFKLVYYQCFAKQWKLVNIQNGCISISKSRIVVKNYIKLIGIDAIWQNVKFIRDNNTKQKFDDLLINIYLNQSEALISQRPSIISEFITRCMTNIMNSNSEPNLITANLIRLLLSFLESLDGLKYNEQEINEGVSKYQISVILKPSTLSQKIELPLNATQGQLRKKVADLLELPFLGFQMSTKNRALASEDDDVQFREMGWSDQIYVTKYGDFENYNFKSMLSQNPVYIDYLLNLLSKETESYIDSVWELLMMLPPNQKTKSDIENLSITSTTAELNWDNLLDSNSVHKLLYALQIVDKIVTGTSIEVQKIESKQIWIQKFCKKGGLNHLYYATIKLPLSSMQHPLGRNCFALLIKLLAIFQAEDENFDIHIRDYSKIRPMFLDRILLLLEQFAHYSILPPSQKEPNHIIHKEKPQQIYKTKEEPSVEARPLPPEIKKESQILVKRRIKQIEESKVFEYGIRLLKYRGSKNFFEPIANFSKLKDLLLKGIILTDNRFIQHTICVELQNICEIFKDIPYHEKHPHVILINVLMKELINETMPKGTKCMPFYNFLCDLLTSISPTKLTMLPLNYHDYLSYLVKLLKSHEIRENTSSDIDFTLVGLLKLTNTLLQKFPEERLFVGTTQQLSVDLLHYLFEFPTTGGNKRGAINLPPKCKSQSARLAAFNLLCTLSTDTPSNLIQIIDYLLPIHMYFLKKDYKKIEMALGEQKDQQIGAFSQKPQKNQLLDMLVSKI